MQHSAQIRAEVESLLESRIPSALSPRVRSSKPLSTTGVLELDALLGGGFPVGAVTEIVGPECSGRTTAALSFVAECTRAGKVCAWVDVLDTMSPHSAAARGVDLDRLLWVRCGGDSPQKRQRIGGGAGPSDQQEREALHTKPIEAGLKPVSWSGSPHPRSEAAGLAEAVGHLLARRDAPAVLPPLRRVDRSIGTPGAANRRLTSAPSRGFAQKAEDRQEQTATDRLPPRRGANARLPGAMANDAKTRGKVYARQAVHEQDASVAPFVWRSSEPPLCVPEAQKTSCNQERKLPRSMFWNALDQALRAVDLVLAGGGFSTIVLDMGSVPAEFAWCVPLATWFRLRAAADRTQVCLLLLTQHPCARSCAEVVLRMAPGEMQTSGKVMVGAQYRAEAERQRGTRDEPKVVFIRKPPQRATTTAWAPRAGWTTGGRP